MHLSLMIFTCLINNIVLCTHSSTFELLDTSSSSAESSSTVSTSRQSSSLSSIFSTSTTTRAYYPDTYSPGAIAGIAIGALLFIFFISISSYCIRRQRLYYLPYFNNYRSI